MENYYSLDIALESLDNKINLLNEDFNLYETDNKFYFKDKNRIISTVSYFDYNIENFDWILLANVDTKKDYRRKGLASMLIDKIYNKIALKRNKGLYVLVEEKNENAIKFYKKINFYILKSYKIKNKSYIIMCKGNKSKTSQFDNLSFGN